MNIMKKIRQTSINLKFWLIFDGQFTIMIKMHKTKPFHPLCSYHDDANQIRSKDGIKVHEFMA